MDLFRRIEELRLELNQLSTYKRLIDQEVIRVSQQLDDALNEYYKLHK
ncbi:aspartyl-phosphate phosphatase Spo0E family protein [Paenibacillus segetis]|uniref:Spo0E like sporulation regulatory protein n=1 Tax=Paenibacillus segetis TaxID=1325360 RepID=A0ABQ1YHT0_9BACL|nr:aspartyl-phosphate phosphatase Spo0E family protein [Paenibacillus segetis]GGH25993.1 hypothetical protein GCM10008013_26590 [Paenibacillus segetis]